MIRSEGEISQERSSLYTLKAAEEKEYRRVKQVLKEQYTVGLGRGVKVLLEYSVIFLMLITCVVKANIVSILYFLLVVLINYCI